MRYTKEELEMAKEAENKAGINALSAKAAYNLANVTKTKPQYGALTPKWLTKFLEFKGLETGIFRVNKVVEGDTPLTFCVHRPRRATSFPPVMLSMRQSRESMFLIQSQR